VSTHNSQPPELPPEMSEDRRGLFLRKVRIALTPRSALLRTRLKNGAVVEGYNRAGYGGRGVYLFRDSLEPELCYLQHFVGRGQVFVDVGANVGVFTVKAAKEVGVHGLVVAVEPFIETAVRLSQNIRVNGYKNVRVRNLCIGARTEHARLHMNRGMPNSFGMLPVGDGNVESMSVLSASLDDLCQWEKLERLDYLKIDAEGAEAAILEGGQNAISRFRPIIQVEITITQSSLGLNYRRFAAPKSLNNVFIPAENKKAVETAMKLGWAELPARSAS
jgi:FkbM family methyltransferase